MGDFMADERIDVTTCWKSGKVHSLPINASRIWLYDAQVDCPRLRGTDVAPTDLYFRQDLEPFRSCKVAGFHGRHFVSCIVRARRLASLGGSAVS